MKDHLLSQVPGQGEIEKVFGKVSPPPQLKPYVDQGGAGGLGLFLSSLIKLVFALAIIVLVFMLVWGAYEWIVSGGDKEKIANARSRIIHAIIGLMLFAVAFAAIEVLGTFTGFTFFERQGAGGQGSPTSCVDEYYPDIVDGASACVHRYPSGSQCIYVVVTASLCGGSSPSTVCTPGEFKDPPICTGVCGGCAQDAGEAIIEQCTSDGSRYSIVRTECRTECAGVCP